jgi:hypothetical protein
MSKVIHAVSEPTAASEYQKIIKGSIAVPLINVASAALNQNNIVYTAVPSVSKFVMSDE